MLLLKKAQVKCILLKEIVFSLLAFQITLKSKIKTESNLLFCSMITKYFCIEVCENYNPRGDSTMLVLVFVRKLPRAPFNYFNPLEPVYLQITHFPTLAFAISSCQSIKHYCVFEIT